MKNIFFLLLLSLLMSCSGDDTNAVNTDANDSTRELLLLKVNFDDNQFEGGHSYEFENVEMGEIIPLEEIWISPGDDFLTFDLKYIPNGDTVF